MDCKYCRVRITAYQQNLLPRKEQQKVEKHIKKCAACRELLLGSTNPRYGHEKENRGKSTIVNRNVLIGAAAIVLFIGFFVYGMENDTSLWGGQEMAGQESLEEINQFGIGTKVMADAESNGVKVTVTHAIADDLQTVLYYQVEDLEQKRQFRIDPQLDREINPEDTAWQRKTMDFRNIIPSADHQNKGKISLPPIEGNQADITIRMEKMIEVENQADPYLSPSQEANQETLEGDWKITIPVEKQQSIEHELNIETEVADIPVRIKKIVMAPTTTLVTYQHNPEEGSHSYFGFEKIETSERSYKIDHFNYGRFGTPEPVSHNSSWITEVIPFESVYFSKPEQLNMHVGTIMKQEEVNKQFPIHPESQAPQTFEFEGTNITLNKLKTGDSPSFEIEEEWTEEREYERLHFEIQTEPASQIVHMESEGIFVTEEGKKYTQEELMEQEDLSMERGRHYTTKTTVRVEDPSGNRGDENIVPVSFNIQSYQVTEYPDSHITIDLPD